MLRASHIIVVDKDKRILLQQRDNRPDVTGAGGWAIWGGATNDNETPEDCAIRELTEETGIIAPKKELRFLSRFERALENYGEVESSVYLLKFGPDMKFKLGEGEGYGFFRKEEIKSPYLGLDPKLKNFLFKFIETL